VSKVRAHADHVKAYNEATQTMASANQQSAAGRAQYSEALGAQGRAQGRLLDDKAAFDSLAKKGATQLADIQKFEQNASRMTEAAEVAAKQVVGKPTISRGLDMRSDVYGQVSEIRASYFKALQANADVSATLGELKSIQQLAGAAAETAQTGRLITRGIQAVATFVFGIGNEQDVWDCTVGGLLNLTFETTRSTYNAGKTAVQSWFSIGPSLSQQTRYYSSGK
jgi:hypothetical protein